MILSMRDIILICVCIISITNAEMNGSITACAESDVEFFCGINETFELHIVLINHQSNEIGRYSYDIGVEVYQRYKDHYVIVKNNNSIQLRITGVREEDRGTLSCTIIYKTKSIKYQRSLIIQEKLTSNIIDLKIKTGTCTVLTCSSSNSSQLKLKKADNKSIIGRNILLNSCIHNLPAGEFSCCLMANCSKAECKTIILQAESSTNFLIPFIVIPVLVVAIVAILLIIICRTRLHKKKRKGLRNLLRDGQRDKSTVYQKDDTDNTTEPSQNSGIRTESGYTKMSGINESNEVRKSEDSGINESNEVRKSEDSGISLFEENRKSENAEGSFIRNLRNREWHVFKKDTRKSTASQTTEMSLLNVYIERKATDNSDTRISTSSQTTEMPNTRVSTATQTSESRVSTGTRSSKNSQGSENLAFTSDNEEDKPILTF